MSLAARLRVEIDTARLVALGTDASGPINRYFLQLGARIDTRAKQKLSGESYRVRTGNLRSSQTFRLDVESGTLRLINENTASYALPLHEGSREHEIVPRRRIALRWIGADGAPAFARKVTIPAHTGRPWLRDSMTEELSAL